MSQCLSTPFFLPLIWDKYRYNPLEHKRLNGGIIFQKGERGSGSGKDPPHHPSRENLLQAPQLHQARRLHSLRLGIRLGQQIMRER
jgi:hypothetical protein